jgi:hypothetical protein
MINKVKRYRFLILILSLLISQCINAQRINFSTWAATSIVVQPVSVNTLDFGNMLLGAALPNDISLLNATAFEIIAPVSYDVVVTLDSPAVLTGPGGNTIPFSGKMAWSNQGTANSTLANQIAVEVPAGFNSVTFPIRKFTGGLPAPPPNPLDGNTTTRTTTKAYIFIYGSAGPASVGIPAGNYTGTMTLTVEYVNN